MNITFGGRGNGKMARAIEAIRESGSRGQHTHAVSKNAGLICVDGPPDCQARHLTLAETEDELRR